MTEVLATVPALALFNHNLLELLKTKGWLKSAFAITLTNWALSLVETFLIVLGDHLQAGERLSQTLIRACITTVLAALYHDFKTSK